MITHNKYKVWVIVLIIISIFSLLLAISVYSRKNIYIAEDKQKFINEVNNLINRSKVKIDNIILNKEEKYIDYKDIKLLVFYHDSLERSIFGFMQKSYFVSSEFKNRFRQLWDNFKYNETINADDIRLYNDQLSKRADSEQPILLNDDDVNKLQEILTFYSETRRGLYNIL